MKTTTKPRGAPWWPGLFVHSDTETRDSKHDACGSPIRSQWLRSVPPVVTDESAVCTAESSACPSYCPKCDVLVTASVTIYKTSVPVYKTSEGE